MSDSQNPEGTAEFKQGDSNDCRTNKSPPSECLDLVPPITQQREYVLSPPGRIKITSVTHDAVSLSWEPPQGLTESMRFRVTWKCESTRDLLCSEVSVANICIQGLTPGVKYEFTVATINDSGGQSTKVVSTAQTTDVLVPKELTVREVTTTSAHLSWTLPHEVDLTPHSFRISYSSAGKDEEFISTSSYSTVITGLQPDTDYTVSVSVVCHSGIWQPASITIHTSHVHGKPSGSDMAINNSSQSTRWPGSTKGDLPTPGQIKIKSVAHDAVSLSWEPPEGLTESLRFRVTWKCESTGKLLCSEVPVPNICIQGLTPEMKYEFTVATINDSRGQSTKVVSTAQTTEVPVPKRLTVEEVTPTSAHLVWALPYNMDLTPHKFLISYSSAGKGQTCILTPWYSTVITGLQPETTYTVRVSVVCYSGTFQPATTTIHTNGVERHPKDQQPSTTSTPQDGVERHPKDQQPSTTSTPQDSWEILTLTDGDERPSKNKEPSITSASEGLVNGKPSGSDWATNNSSHVGSGARREEAQISTNLLLESLPSGKTYYTLAPGKSAEYSRDIERWLKPLTKAKSVQSCDMILAACLVVSRVGTDVEAALKAIPDDKPTILVVLHHTIDRDCVVPDSSRFAKRDDMLIVDCLFNEDDGLLRCERNDTAQSKMPEWIHAKVSGPKVSLFGRLLP